MFIVKCPKCDQFIIIQELNCSIFRHAIFKNNFKQIPPHSSKKIINELINNDLIYGCGTPFKIVDNKAILCDYI